MPLLEREPLLAALGESLTATVAGGSVVLVAGEAGIGKTALVRAHADRASADGARVAWSRCDDLAVPRALGAVQDLAVHADPALREALRGGRRADVLEAVRTELARVAPTVWIVEDVHWADGATLDVLSFLGRRIEELPAVVVLTFRDDELGSDHGLRRVLGALPPTVVRRLHVPPLSPAAVAELAGTGADELYAVTGGNAFFVTEAIAAGRSQPPPSVRDAVLARAARLTAGARAALDLVAVVPGATELWLLRETAPDASEQLAECEERGLLQVERGVVRFRHELARRVVEADLPGARRAALHRTVLDALEPWHVDPARLVHHATEAGDPQRTIAWSFAAAAAAAASRAHDEAAAHYARVVDLAPMNDPEQLATAVEGLSEEAYYASQPELALDAGQRAVELRRAIGGRPLGDALRHLSRLHWWGRGDGVAAERAGDEAVAILEPLGPSSGLALAYANRSQLLMLAQRDAEAIEVGERAMAMARSLGDDRALVHSLATVGLARMRGPGWDDGCALLEDAIELGLRCGFDEQACRAAGNLAWISADHHRPEAAARCERALALALAREQRTFAFYMLANRARLDLAAGRWDAVVSTVEELLAQPDLPVVSRMPALYVLALVELRRGLPRADALLDEALQLARGSGELQRLRPVACARAELAWLRADLEGVERETREAYALALEVGHEWDVGELASWRWRAGAVVERPDLCAEPHRLLVQGDARGAAACWLAIGDRYQAALCLAAAEDAESLLRALALLDELGADAAGRRVRRALRDLGVVNVPRGPRRSTRANPAGLTARQLEILTYLAAGSTNADIARQLFLATKTVEHHVGAVLAKLGAATRVEAVSRGRALGLVEPGGVGAPT